MTEVSDDQRSVARSTSSTMSGSGLQMVKFNVAEERFVPCVYFF